MTGASRGKTSCEDFTTISAMVQVRGQGAAPSLLAFLLPLGPRTNGSVPYSRNHDHVLRAMNRSVDVRNEWEDARVVKRSNTYDRRRGWGCKSEQGGHRSLISRNEYAAAFVDIPKISVTRI